MEKSIFVTCELEALHCWPSAPPEVFYLRDIHRHVFKFFVAIGVSSEDREIEFVMVKHVLQEYLSQRKKEWPSYVSCETMARETAEFIQRQYGNRDVSVSVSEDGENGALIKITKREGEEK